MKHKKTVTDAVRAANRHNAQSSTGPRTEHGKSKPRHNALRHGILAKGVVLETHEERAEFRKLLERCKSHYDPDGLLEEFLVEDVAFLKWKLRISLGLEIRELSLRQDVRDQVGSIFHGTLNLPISESDLPLNRGWDCERIVVRAVAGKDDRQSSASRGPAVVQNQVMSAFQKFREPYHSASWATGGRGCLGECPRKDEPLPLGIEARSLPSNRDAASRASGKT